MPSDASIEPSSRYLPKVAIFVLCALLVFEEIDSNSRPGVYVLYLHCHVR